MRIEYAHTLTKDEARARLEALGEYLGSRHNIQVVWNGDRATFAGKFTKMVKIAGEMTCGEGKVLFNGEDPGFPWRSQATKYIKTKLDAYLDPGTPVEDLRRS